ncbi:secreted RxLR effector protein 161-like [Pistacia vera]|uniref:secreted RxLR effector protein 161-like n=1 Tax=Pistacia vera TaxID=55513 RepID=UPI001262BC58|nr:secreted RxLR effector protein 161-like [Pistacia vera]
MDVVFHEELMYFSSEPELQGEYCQEEIQTLDYVVQDVGDYESQTRPVETSMSVCQPAYTPIEKGLKLGVEVDQVPVDKGRYQRLVGRLMYLSHTRPNLAYALSVVSQFIHNPGEQHMNAVTRILRYLEHAPGKGILFTKNKDYQNVNAYTDADWARVVADRRSTSGYFTFVGGNLVTWRSKKQNVVARLSAEAKFRGIALGICEALWLRFLLQNLGYQSI